MSPSIEGASASGGGTMSLGSYAMAMRGQDQRGRRRTMMTLVSLTLALVVAGAAIYAASPFGSGSGGPSIAALLGAPPASQEDDHDSDEPPAESAETLVEPEEGLDQGAIPIDEADDPVTYESASAAAAADLASVREEADAVSEAAADGTGRMEDGEEVRQHDQDAQDAQHDKDAQAAALPLEATTMNAIADGAASDGLTAPLLTEQSPASVDVESASADPVVWRNGWVCDGEIQVQDSRTRDWSLGKVSFQHHPGFERVVLHMNRIREGSGEPASVTAEAFSTSSVRGSVPNVRRPSHGKTTVVMHLADGIKGNLGLRGYRPSGLSALKEFSVYPAARGSSRVLVSAAADQCFRLRVPAWTSQPRNAQKAQIWLDIKD